MVPSVVDVQGSLPAFLTVDELAAVLRCQPEKVYRLAAHGHLPSYKVEGRRLFDEREVTVWLATQHEGPTLDGNRPGR
jgi:excisionase family DNA binding protein